MQCGDRVFDGDTSTHIHSLGRLFYITREYTYNLSIQKHCVDVV